jgi:CheY-like chemotaxis protein
MWAEAQPCVLVVEDDFILRNGIVVEFQSEGWLVLDTATGEEAVDLASDTHVDAVFTDIQLAGRIDGWDVAEVLRQSNPALPVVYASGNAADRSRQVMESRFFDKPYVPTTVIETCKELVLAHRNADGTRQSPWC